MHQDTRPERQRAAFSRRAVLTGAAATAGAATLGGIPAILAQAQAPAAPRGRPPEPAPVGCHGESEQRKVREWDKFAVFIEICGTDLDAGLKILLGGEPWKRATVFAPDGRPIYWLGPRLGDVGSGTVFLESAEPPFAGFPLDKFLDRFPEGEYMARGTTLEEIELEGTAELARVQIELAAREESGNRTSKEIFIHVEDHR
jgi:hypothetical protein